MKKKKRKKKKQDNNVDNNNNNKDDDSAEASMRPNSPHRTYRIKFTWTSMHAHTRAVARTILNAR